MLFLTFYTFLLNIIFLLLYSKPAVLRMYNNFVVNLLLLNKILSVPYSYEFNLNTPLIVHKISLKGPCIQLLKYRKGIMRINKYVPYVGAGT